MIEIEAARSIVWDNAQVGIPERVPLPRALGRVLAKEITAPVDAPPHDKSLVDGYAIRTADLAKDGGRLAVIEEVAAGQVPRRTVESGQATRIMTGAVIPAGADGVVMLEHTRTETNESGEFVHISATARPGMNLQRRGDIIKANHLLLPSGRRIRAIEIGLLAEFGVAEVDAFPVPQVGILPTGDELVDFTQSPSPGRIRNSNGPLLDALVRTSGAEPVELGIGPDRYDDLSRLVERGLQTDILVLSGGVSMGQKDLVPQVLRDCGVRMIFHRVRLRPGKPAWFGILDGGNRRTLVFGLPGNPVSTLVCFLLLVRPAIHRMLGFGHLEPFQTATLAREHTMLDERPTLFPARRVGVNSVETLAWRGSSDQVTMTDSDCLVFFRTPRVYPPGDVVEVLDFDAPHGG